MTVTICLPTYNGERFVAAAIESILTQTYSDFELIVSDDCSSDRTCDIVSSFRDSRLRLETHDRRLGLVGNWNRCLELAQGEYVYIFHQDDRMAANNVESQVRVLDQYPTAGMVFSNVQIIDSDDNIVGGHWTPCLPNRETLFSGQDFFQLVLGKGNLVPCQTVMVRSVCYSELGGFDSRLRYTPDLEMWLRIGLRHDVAYLPEPLVMLRHHERQESRRYMGGVEEVNEVWRAFRIFFSEHRAQIPDRDALYDQAMEHLQSWALISLRASLRKGQIASVRSFAKEWVRFGYARRRGLRGLGSLSSANCAAVGS